MGRTGRRLLWGLGTLVGLMAVAVVAWASTWVYALIDPATRMPPAETLPFALTAAERDSLLDLYSPLPEKRISAARGCVNTFTGGDPQLAAQVAPFLVGLLSDGETPKNRCVPPGLSLAYLKSLIWPPEVSFEVRPLLCNSWMRPDLAATWTLGKMGKPAVEPLVRVLHDSQQGAGPPECRPGPGDDRRPSGPRGDPRGTQGPVLGGPGRGGRRTFRAL